MIFKFYKPEDIIHLCPSKRQIAAMQDWAEHQSERRQRRFAEYKAQVEHYWRLYPWLICSIILLALTCCAQTKYVVPNDTITQTNTRTITIQRDSIYLHDSIYVREYIQGDTVYRDKIVEHWKDRWLSRADTLQRCDTITITQTQTIKEPVKYVPGFYKWCAGILIVVVIGIIARIVIKVMK